jgi:inactivated superfamily I helicase
MVLHPGSDGGRLSWRNIAPHPRPACFGAWRQKVLEIGAAGQFAEMAARDKVHVSLSTEQLDYAKQRLAGANLSIWPICNCYSTTATAMT